jgi:hypothetical protein
LFYVCLAEEVISAAAAAAEQKNDDNYPTASTIITATASATVTATATATEAAAAATEAQDNDQPDNIEAAIITTSSITSASTVSCCQITHIGSSK